MPSAAPGRYKRSVKNLLLDSKFQLDFNTAFATGPARPHGLAVK